MLIQTPLRPIALGTVLDRALVVPSDLCGRPPMPLLLLIVDLERHVQHYLVVAFV